MSDQDSSDAVERLAIDCWLVTGTDGSSWDAAPDHVKHQCRKSAAGILIDRKFRSGAPFAEVQDFHRRMRQLLNLTA